MKTRNSMTYICLGWHHRNVRLQKKDYKYSEVPYIDLPPLPMLKSSLRANLISGLPVR